MKPISNYVSAAILLTASILLAGMATNILRDETITFAGKDSTSNPQISWRRLPRGSFIIIVNKTGNEPIIIGNYTVLANTSSILIIQSNTTLTIITGGQIIEAP